ncbi:hypothetical protein WDW37_08265 [Bdellovibrionota bacterium FG-1]
MDQNTLRSLLLTAELPDKCVQRSNRDALPHAPPPPDLGELLGFEPQSQSVGLSTNLSLPPLPPPHPNTGLGGVPAHLASLIPALMRIKGLILQELAANPLKLRTLNVSRREALSQHLEKMAGQSAAPATNSSHKSNPDGSHHLRCWIEGPRGPAQNTALQAYFEEIALLVLGQAILLKAWSDRGLRTWSKLDLGQLNWALSSALRPQVPLDREGWAITRQNIYSWYNPGPSLQQELWTALEEYRIKDEGPGILSFLMGPSRQVRLPDGCATTAGYDARFFKAVWDHSPLFGFHPQASTGPLKRTKVVFSPTLREGSMVRVGPVALSWIGLEASAFSLINAELVQLWWGPAPPPLWVVGNGLEVHARDQLSLALGAPKPSLMSRITEMEACDAAFVLEERAVRPQGRTLEAQRLKEQLDALPYFKKLRSPTTCLGALQACVALSKLRPGGLLWWAREEPLTTTEGTDVLHFLMERGKIVCEWNFSDLEHTLPVQIPLFPKHLYLIARESRVEERLNHRPVRVSLQGQIRSHVEIPLVLEDALGSLHRPVTPHGHWKVHVQPSPTTQRDWMDHWPDPTSQTQIRLLENLRSQSLPLASVTNIKVTPDGDPAHEGAWSVHASMKGLWIRAENGGEGRHLVAEPLPKANAEAKGSGFMILVPDENWIAPLLCYFRSPEIRAWLEHNSERRADRWALKEQTVRFIPVPKLLLRALGVSAAIDGTPTIEREAASFALPLPGEWEKLAAEIPRHPRVVLEALEKLQNQIKEGSVHEDAANSIRANLFVRAARAQESLATGQSRLLSVVTSDGRIRWRELLEVLPKAELTPVTFHSQIRIVGQIPPHIPIGRFDRIKMPEAGILLSTELGMNTQLFSESALLLDMLWEQLDGLIHPTWSELVQYLRLPRRLEIAETTASDVLRSHGEQTRHLRELGEIIKACRLF